MQIRSAKNTYFLNDETNTHQSIVNLAFLKSSVDGVSSALLLFLNKDERLLLKFNKSIQFLCELIELTVNVKFSHDTFF